jgi:hypothetical protein
MVPVLLSELADKIDELVRHRLAQCVVIDRAKGATEVA